MSDDVNTSGGEDRVTHDHDAGIGASADDLDTHNPDLEDYDKVLDEFAQDDDDDSSGETETTDDSDSDADKSGTDETGEDKESGEKTVPYDRFKEVNDKYREMERLNARLEGRLEAIERGMSQQPPKVEEPTALPLDDLLSQQDPQAILDALQENPVEFFGKLEQRSIQKVRESLVKQNEEAMFHKKLTDSLDKFAAERDGFFDHLEDMARIVQQDPAQNLISAYAYNVEIPAMKQTYEGQITQLKGELEKVKEAAFKEGRKKALEEIKAKGAAAVLDGSQASRGASTTVDPELSEAKDPHRLRQTITDRLLRRRATK